MKSLEAVLDIIGTQPDAKYHCHGPFLKPDMDGPVSADSTSNPGPLKKSHSAAQRIGILLVLQIIKYRWSRITQAALTQKQNTSVE